MLTTPLPTSTPSLLPEPAIVFQHRDFVVLNKPAGFSVQELSKHYQTAFAHFHPVHRLDKDTSGVWLVAKTALANQQLSQAFLHQAVSNHYIALVHGGKRFKKKQGWIVGDMQKSRRKAWRLLASKQNPATTYFETLSLPADDGVPFAARLAYLQPLSGKTHQLRVAMKANGSPIVGDNIYRSAQANAADRLYLHAFKLCFSYQGESFVIHAWPRQGEYFLTAGLQKRLEAFEPRPVHR